MSGYKAREGQGDKTVIDDIVKIQRKQQLSYLIYGHSLRTVLIKKWCWDF